MGYIGNQSSEAYSSVDKQVITGNGGTAYTLSHSVANANEIEVFVNNVRQEPGVAYNVSAGTSLAMTGNVASTDDFYVVFQGKAVQTATHPTDAPLTASQINADNIRLDGNTISSTDTNGDITLDPNGTGDTVIASGNVGIGTSSPSFGSGSGLEIERAGVTTLRLDDTTNSTAIELKAAIGAVSVDGRTNHPMLFATNGAERMRIDNSGNVGIGCTPTTKFQVQGASNANNIEIGGDYIQSFNRSGSPGYQSLPIFASDFKFYAAGAERMRLNNNGSLLVGTTSASMTGFDDARFRSHANGKTGIIVSEVFTDGEGIIIQGSSNTGNRNAIVFLNGGLGTVGSVVFSSSSTSYNTSSDYRLKENVADMTGAITRVKALAPKRFNFIADADTTVDGFLAHEAQAVVPEAVTGEHNEVNEDGNAVMQGIDQSKLVPLLTGALQEAIAKIETLETEMTALKARVTALEAE